MFERFFRKVGMPIVSLQRKLPKDLKEFYENANTAAAMCGRLSRKAYFKKKVTQAGGDTVTVGLLTTSIGAVTS